MNRAARCFCLLLLVLILVSHGAAQTPAARRTPHRPAAALRPRTVERDNSMRMRIGTRGPQIDLKRLNPEQRRVIVCSEGAAAGRLKGVAHHNYMQACLSDKPRDEVPRSTRLQK